MRKQPDRQPGVHADPLPGGVFGGDVSELHDRPGDVSSFWTVATTAMSQAEAVAASEAIARDYPGVQADPVDPRDAMMMFLDRRTAQMIRDAVAAHRDAGHDTGSMVEMFDEWLAQAADDDHDE